MTSAALAPAGDGHLLVAVAPEGRALVARRLDADGVPREPLRPLVRVDDRDETLGGAVLAERPGGGYLVVFARTASDGRRAVWSVVLDGYGAPVGAPRRLTEPRRAGPQPVGLAVDRRQRAVVVLSGERRGDGGQEIRALLLSSQGQPRRSWPVLRSDGEALDGDVAVEPRTARFVVVGARAQLSYLARLAPKGRSIDPARGRSLPATNPRPPDARLRRSLDTPRARDVTLAAPSMVTDGVSGRLLIAWGAVGPAEDPSFETSKLLVGNLRSDGRPGSKLVAASVERDVDLPYLRHRPALGVEPRGTVVVAWELLDGGISRYCCLSQVEARRLSRGLVPWGSSQARLDAEDDPQGPPRYSSANGIDYPRWPRSPLVSASETSTLVGWSHSPFVNGALVPR